MVEGGDLTEFPVVFYDGEREMNIGSIRIYPTIEFKAFQLMLSQRIGISPNQISIYLCDKKCSKFEDRRRIPITGKSNFRLIALEKNCFILVVLKRSRKSRNRKGKVDFGVGFLSENNYLSDNLVLLRRNQNNFGLVSPFYDQVSQTELENFMYLDNPYPYLNPDPFPRIQDTYPMMKKNLTVCKECRTSTFHHCVNDPVIAGGYNNRYGPVARPVNMFQPEFSE